MIVLIPLIFFPQPLPWNRPIYDTKLGGWPEKAGNPSPHPNLRIPAPTWGSNFNIINNNIYILFKLIIIVIKLKLLSVLLDLVISTNVTIIERSLKRVLIESIRLNKISVALCDLRSRYITLNLLARILINLITIIISLYYNK